MLIDDFQGRIEGVFEHVTHGYGNYRGEFTSYTAYSYRDKESREGAIENVLIVPEVTDGTSSRAKPGDNIKIERINNSVFIEISNLTYTRPLRKFFRKQQIRDVKHRYEHQPDD